MTQEQMSSYRQSIGYVPQESYLMAGTVADNISFSQWGKPADIKCMQPAARRRLIFSVKILKISPELLVKMERDYLADKLSELPSHVPCMLLLRC